MSEEQNDTISLSRTVRLGPQEAFDVFTTGFGAWYPSAYTWSGELLEYIGIEAGEGGHCSELGPHGFRCDWGRVLVWEPPRRLVLSWQISFARLPVPDPSRASEVEVRWQAVPDGGTRVDFTHRGFSRHGEEWREYLAAMSSEGGWPYILDLYVVRAQTEVHPS